MHHYWLVAPIIVDGQVFVFKQYKRGPHASCIAFPPGKIEKEESSLEAAKRGLFEETGYQAKIGYILENTQSTETKVVEPSIYLWLEI